MKQTAQRIQYVSSKIKELREECSWSQSTLAEKAGITASAISMIESKQRSPSLIVIRKISDALKVSVSELTGETPQEEANQQTQAFFRQFSDLDDLDEGDKKMIMDIVKRLKEKTDAQGSD